MAEIAAEAMGLDRVGPVDGVLFLNIITEQFYRPEELVTLIRFLRSLLSRRLRCSDLKLAIRETAEGISDINTTTLRTFIERCSGEEAIVVLDGMRILFPRAAGLATETDLPFVVVERQLLDGGRVGEPVALYDSENNRLK